MVWKPEDVFVTIAYIVYFSHLTQVSRSKNFGFLYMHHITQVPVVNGLILNQMNASWIFFVLIEVLRTSSYGSVKWKIF